VRTLLLVLGGVVLVAAGWVVLAASEPVPSDFGWFAYTPGGELESDPSLGDVLWLEAGPLAIGSVLGAVGVLALAGPIGYGAAGRRSGRTAVVAGLGVVLVLAATPVLRSASTTPLFVGAGSEPVVGPPADLLAPAEQVVVGTGSLVAAGALAVLGLALAAAAVGHRAGRRA
jgi:hypothetical protein